MLKSVLLLLVYSCIYGTDTRVFKAIEELIVGGDSTKIEEVPYQVAFYYHGNFFCGGCIISTRHILTAAHCFALIPKTVKGLTVRAGSAKAFSGGQVTSVKRVSIHPKYSIVSGDYDVAVVELKTPLKLTNSVQPLEIGKREPKEGEEVRVSGWGFMKETGPPSRKLQSVLVKVVSRKKCAKNYKDIVVVTKRMLCASGEGKDSCFGDSGGPLVHNGKVVGIVSSGEGCARKEYPGIYTNVINKDIQKFIKEEVDSVELTDEWQALFLRFAAKKNS